VALEQRRVQRSGIHVRVMFKDHGDVESSTRRGAKRDWNTFWQLGAILRSSVSPRSRPSEYPLAPKSQSATPGFSRAAKPSRGDDHLQLALVILVATLGELTGSTIGYAIGRFGGRSLIDRVGKYVLLTRKDLDRAEAWFARRGESVVFFGRFVPLVRSFVSIAAGIGEMAVAKFLVFTLAACALWCGLLAGIGFALGSSWHRIITDFSYVGYLAAALVIVVALSFIVHRLRQLRLERAVVPEELR
jgi:membrane protein DedA with SNARE-associated domain